MKRQKLYQQYDKDEFAILSEQLDSKEMMILSYLKGFDRKIMREWQRKGLYD
ncbi:hypothetical protein J4218_04375 [Candidatus Pacearchaeota archaeon]|nr:hypothetical protein [Candidatus Pacearchaeota archaeon]